MDVTNFKAIITNIGESKVAAILFDNSSRKHFQKDEFTLATVLVESISCLKFEETDLKGNKYYTYKPVETVQGIVSVDDPKVLALLDRRYISN